MTLKCPSKLLAVQNNADIQTGMEQAMFLPFLIFISFVGLI